MDEKGDENRRGGGKGQRGRPKEEGRRQNDVADRREGNKRKKTKKSSLLSVSPTLLFPFSSSLPHLLIILTLSSSTPTSSRLPSVSLWRPAIGDDEKKTHEEENGGREIDLREEWGKE
jgi:hypothetical protein